MIEHTKQIRVGAEDVEKMRTTCRALYLRAHPEMRGLKLTDKKMYYELVRYYIES